MILTGGLLGKNWSNLPICIRAQLSHWCTLFIYFVYMLVYGGRKECRWHSLTQFDGMFFCLIHNLPILINDRGCQFCQKKMQIAKKKEEVNFSM
jgi:hypothetical protein